MVIMANNLILDFVSPSYVLSHQIDITEHLPCMSSHCSAYHHDCNGHLYLVLLFLHSK